MVVSALRIDVLVDLKRGIWMMYRVRVEIAWCAGVVVRLANLVIVSWKSSCKVELANKTGEEKGEVVVVANLVVPQIAKKNNSSKFAKSFSRFELFEIECNLHGGAVALSSVMAATDSVAVMDLPVEPQSLKKLSFKSLKRALDLFSPMHGHHPPSDLESKRVRVNYKLQAEYGSVANLSGQQAVKQNKAQEKGVQGSMSTALVPLGGQEIKASRNDGNQGAVIPAPTMLPKGPEIGTASRNTGVLVSATDRYNSTSALMERIPSRWPRPSWHPPWKNYRVISGHLGWVRSIAFDPSNTWFCTGSADRTIKRVPSIIVRCYIDFLKHVRFCVDFPEADKMIWDVASGRLKLTLTGHIEQIRGLAVSQKHTYLFSAGDDKQVKCWDLEQNKVIRSYHGHLSGVYCLALHPTIDVLLTGGRDSVCRVWDIRSKAMVMALSGHDNTVCSVFARPTDPQVVTGSHDSTIKFWDLVAGKTMTTLTHHKKSVRAMALHPKERSFASASADNIKKFNLPKGEFLHNMLSQQKTIINSMAVNEDGILATAGDNGSLWFWDWKSGHNFQQAQTIVQPGSLDSEACIYALSYDNSGSRLVTCEADKTIKMWKEDTSATPETHPINFKPPKEFRRY
ncbi:hypothetical protein ZIOFF_056758 [Zingiber officinale]|uniref:Protein pleiotropic regulatory locus 1 n=1 Tax=Zingiber officinale TaxID=94328 RepID=A0A8J5KSW0_ZINOF|nr:hypothetical protein ZIOFF_056758 [Zingiber officinale]